MSIVQLVKAPWSPDQTLLEFIDKTKEQLLSGELGNVEGIAVAYYCTDASTGSGYHAPRVAPILGAIEFMKTEILE